MNIIIMGPQASGKGTQAALLCKEKGLTHFSTGDALRTEAESGTALGNKVKKIMDSGALVPDGLLADIVKKAVDTYDDILFDGYPRTVKQAEYLATLTEINAVVTITISDEEAVKRISSRLVCTGCGASYNTNTQPPIQEGICNQCSAQLVQRDDDQPDAVRKRLALYHQATEPVFTFYESRGVPVHHINGEQGIEAVHGDILHELKET